MFVNGGPDNDGRTDKLNGEFTYRYKDIHYSRHRVTELIPGKLFVRLFQTAA